MAEVRRVLHSWYDENGTEYLTVPHLATRLEVSAPTVAHWIEQGRWPHTVDRGPGRKPRWLVAEADVQADLGDALGPNAVDGPPARHHPPSPAAVPPDVASTRSPDARDGPASLDGDPVSSDEHPLQERILNLEADVRDLRADVRNLIAVNRLLLDSLWQRAAPNTPDP